MSTISMQVKRGTSSSARLERGMGLDLANEKLTSKGLAATALRHTSAGVSSPSVVRASTRPTRGLAAVQYYQQNILRAAAGVMPVLSGCVGDYKAGVDPTVAPLLAAGIVAVAGIAMASFFTVESNPNRHRATYEMEVSRRNDAVGVVTIGILVFLALGAMAFLATSSCDSTSQQHYEYSPRQSYHGDGGSPF